jgi:hypothetical protein
MLVVASNLGLVTCVEITVKLKVGAATLRKNFQDGSYHIDVVFTPI